MNDTNYQLATFGGGCFWCTEAIFNRVEGVLEVTSGYSGGTIKNPAYREVCTGRTGHAEVVQLAFNPSMITYHELLEIFFATHDPTTLNRQGNDVGTQYRSAIFFHDSIQKDCAEHYITTLNTSKVYTTAIVTELMPFETFYPAEKEHRAYFAKHPEHSFCQVVIHPKVKKFETAFTNKLKK